ncbi:hypothetical protein B0O80DRAFT_258556 [Mortierella sp. GBAus27b]|nr:hypothetical protein B0O80DRAFT_258556 [Mortierella sp. GBAus27b]
METAQSFRQAGPIDPATSPTTHSTASGIYNRARDPAGTDSPMYDTGVKNLQTPTSDNGKLSQRTEVEPRIEQRLVSFLPPDVQTQVLASSDIHGSIVQAIQDGQVERLHEQFIACWKDLRDQLVKNNELTLRNNELVSNNVELTSQVAKLQEALSDKQEEMEQLQGKAFDQLALLQNRVQALVAQSYELHDYPLPRLFVVLPQDTSSWNAQDFFSNKFRLYFLCECGEHTKSANSRIPHHIHLAKQEGYEIYQPTEFFQRYGSYVLTILKMLKFGVSVTGVAVPPLSHLLRSDSHDQTMSLKMTTGDIQAGISQIIGSLEKIANGNSEAIDEFSGQVGKNEALGGVDLRELETFLEIKDGNRALGNLYRTVTTEGHVKWVCIDHSHMNYHGKAAQSFRDVVDSLMGSFDENAGRVDVLLRSRVQAEPFYQVLANTRSVYELKIGLDWDTTLYDFKMLRDSLLKSNVGVLSIDLYDRGCPTIDILNRNIRHDPIFDIMAHPSIRAVTIARIQDFIKRSSLLYRSDDFSNLRRLVIQQQEIPGLQALIARAPSLSSLVFQGSMDDCLLAGRYLTVAEYQTYPIIFTDRSLCIPPLTTGSHRAAHHYLEHLLDVEGANIRTLALRGGSCEKAVVDAFAGLQRSRTGLTYLVLGSIYQDLGSQFIKNLARIVSRSELDSLDVNLGNEEGRAQILESIQWEHVRDLDIAVDREIVGVRAIQILVDSTEKMSSGRVKVESFRFYCSSEEIISAELSELVRSFVASTRLKTLKLGVTMTPSAVVSVLQSTDVSQLEEVVIRAEGFTSDQVDSVLDCLENADKSRGVYLLSYHPTQKQKERMKRER